MSSSLPSPRLDRLGGSVVVLAFSLSIPLGLAGCPDRQLEWGLDGGDETPGAGLPCDVAQLLADQCTSCHRAGSTAAPMSLVTRDALLAPTPSDPGTTAIAHSLARMQDARFPMPPGAPPSAADVAILQAWVNAGTPSGSCDTEVDAGPPGCTSGTHWTRGDDGSKDMHPGLSCVACHVREGEDDWEVPRVVGGTVYAGYREEDDCLGTNGGADRLTVVVTDADGYEVSLSVRASGNFGSNDALRFPVKAKVVSASGKVREMVRAVDHGDCNTCHTATGTDGAPGRIRAP